MKLKKIDIVQMQRHKRNKIFQEAVKDEYVIGGRFTHQLLTIWKNGKARTIIYV